MAEMLYPERQRCRTCRFSLGGLSVVRGMYCSHRCAGMPEPASDPEDAPRWCRRQVDGRWGFKSRFTHEQAAPRRIREDPSSNLYWCDHCGYLHIGHSRVPEAAPEKLQRRVRDLAELGSVIQRHRESRGIDKRALARSMGVPIVRITEIERGDRDMNPAALMSLLTALRLDLALIER